MFNGLIGTFQCSGHVTLHFVQLRISVNRGKRSTQLMAGIGNEPFHLLGRFLLRVEAFLNTR